jgi:ribosomal protein S18 acetylase RimI-like enzyme
MDVVITAGQWPAELGDLLHDLPEWFGIEASVANYVVEARSLPTVAAFADGEIVGICVVRLHPPVAAEIEVLAVRRSLHRQGIGRQLIDHVEADLRSCGTRLLQVKTFGPSGVSDEYARTRAFYEAIGFIPLEERTDIWGPDNPCLISVKPLNVRTQGSQQ